MFADLCLAIAAHEFLLEQHNLHRRFDHSFFRVEHVGNELRMSLDVIRTSANNSFKGYLTYMSTERDIFEMFKVSWVILLCIYHDSVEQIRLPLNRRKIAFQVCT